MPHLSRLQSFAVIGLVTLILAGCGRKGALEPPPGDATVRAEPKRNTFFNPSAKIEAQKDDIDPSNLPLNPQLGVGGTLVTTTKKATTGPDKGPGVAPVGGGRKAKRILPPKDSPFILDPLL